MTKLITCINCSKFCRNNDIDALTKKIQTAQDEGYTEIVFLCEILKNFFIKNKPKKLPDLKIGWKDNKGKIIYF